jgi:hypothetical protein
MAYVKLKHVLRSSRLVEGIRVNKDTGRIHPKAISLQGPYLQTFLVSAP